MRDLISGVALYLINARLPLNAQRLDKALLPMFLAKLADLALREACSAAAGGRFSKLVVGLYAYVGMNPGVQLVTELNTTHMSYINLSTLVLALPKRQFALQKSTAEQRLMCEMLRVLDKAQHKECDQDVARSLCEMRDKALADFSSLVGDRNLGLPSTRTRLAKLPTKWRCALLKRLFGPAA